jgi:hypothetical protein
VSADRAAVERTLDAARIAVIKARACCAEWAFIAPAADRGDAEARDAMWEKGRPIGQAAQRAETELETALAYLAKQSPLGRPARIEASSSTASKPSRRPGYVEREAPR